MTNSDIKKEPDCTPCRLVGASGITAIGAYILSTSPKTKVHHTLIRLFGCSFIGLGVYQFYNLIQDERNKKKV